MQRVAVDSGTDLTALARRLAELERRGSTSSTVDGILADHEARITANTTGLATTNGTVSTLSSTVSGNTSTIGSHTSTLSNHESRLSTAESTLASRPLGVTARGFVTTSSTAATTTSAMRLDNVALTSGRAYRIYTNGFYLFSSVGGITYTATIRLNTAGTATTSSGQLPGGAAEGKAQNGGGTGGHAQIDTVYVPASNVTASLLVMATVSTGSGTIQVYSDATNPLMLTVEDIGAAPSNTAVDL